MRRMAEKALNAAVIAALVAGLVAWWAYEWPPERWKLQEVNGQFVSHQFTRERGEGPRDTLVVQDRDGNIVRIFIAGGFLPKLETLSGQFGSASVDRFGRAYRLEVNGVERLAFETVRAQQTRRAFGVLIGGGLTYALLILLIAFHLSKLLQPSEPRGGEK
jgi:hypothetical protein